MFIKVYSLIFGSLKIVLGDRLTVGHCPLEAGIGVRIPVPQHQSARYRGRLESLFSDVFSMSVLDHDGSPILDSYRSPHRIDFKGFLKIIFGSSKINEIARSA